MWKFTFGSKEIKVSPVVFVGILMFFGFLCAFAIYGAVQFSILLFDSVWPLVILTLLSVSFTVNDAEYGLLPNEIRESKPFVWFIRALSVVFVLFGLFYAFV